MSPALAVAAVGSGAPAHQDGKPHPAAVQERTGAGLLARPAREWQNTIQVGVEKIRAQKRRKSRNRCAHLPGGVSRAKLNAIAACESGGNPHAVSSGGTYRGKYQFDYGTWASVGGHGDPAAAPGPDQDYRAALLYERSSSSPWPVCG